MATLQKKKGIHNQIQKDSYFFAIPSILPIFANLYFS